jgi:hypothetical protein
MQDGLSRRLRGLLVPRLRDVAFDGIAKLFGSAERELGLG